jgi:hypothetical protein
MIAKFRYRASEKRVLSSLRLEARSWTEAAATAAEGTAAGGWHNGAGIVTGAAGEQPPGPGWFDVAAAWFYIAILVVAATMSVQAVEALCSSPLCSTLV